MTPREDEVRVLSDFFELKSFERIYECGVIDRFKIMAGIDLNAAAPQFGTAMVPLWMSFMAVSVEIKPSEHGEELLLKFSQGTLSYQAQYFSLLSF